MNSKILPGEQPLKDITQLRPEENSEHCSKIVTDYNRLPCRGCLKTCLNYHKCKSVPWRFLKESLKNGNA